MLTVDISNVYTKLLLTAFITCDALENVYGDFFLLFGSKLHYPDDLLIFLTIAEIVTHNANLCVLNDISLTFFVKAVECNDFEFTFRFILFLFVLALSVNLTLGDQLILFS